MTPEHRKILSDAAKAVRKIDDDLSQVLSELSPMNRLDFSNVFYVAEECDHLSSALKRFFWMYPEKSMEMEKATNDT